MPLIAPPRFALGRLLATPAALRILRDAGVSPSQLLRRHASNDYRNLCAADVQANETAIRSGGRILSAYQVNDDRLYVITEADRSATTILLASEY